jgi:hypothetical protein
MPMFHLVLAQTGPEWDRSQPLEGQTRWPEHAAFMDDLVECGFIVLGRPVPDHRRGSSSPHGLKVQISALSLGVARMP